MEVEAINKNKNKKDFLLTKNRCLGCREVITAVVGQKMKCTCNHGVKGAKIPKPKSKTRVSLRWEHVSTLSPEETEELKRKAANHDTVRKERRKKNDREYHKRKRENKTSTTTKPPKRDEDS